MKIEGIDHVQIAAPCDSEDMLRQFYVGLLGFEEIEKPVALKGRGGVWFNCGNMQLHVGIDAEPPMNEPSRRHIAFRIRSLEECRRALRSAGLTIEEDKAPIPGAIRLYLRDPVGNRVELLQPLKP